MRSGFRVCFSQTTVVLDCVFQTALYVPVIRRVIRNTVLLGYESVTWRNDMHVFRPSALNGSEALRIQRELKDRGRLCFEGELAVVYLIRPRSELAGTLDTPEHIGASKPAPIGEGRLNDNIDTLFHRSFDFNAGIFFTRLRKLDG